MFLVQERSAQWKKRHRSRRADQSSGEDAGPARKQLSGVASPAAFVSGSRCVQRPSVGKD